MQPTRLTVYLLAAGLIPTLAAVGVALFGGSTILIYLCVFGFDLGVMIALAVRPPLWAAAALVGLFAIFHGHAHGAELPHAAQPLAPLKIILKGNGGTVQVTVKGTDGKPQPNYSVEIVPDPPRRKQKTLYSQCGTDA